MNKTLVTGIMLVVLVGGALVGYVVLRLPLVLSIICCSFGAAFAMFVGMVLFASVAKENTDIAVCNAIQDVKSSLACLFVQQRGAYLELLRASSRIVARRVAERTVTEMMHGLDNDEQRDAAFRQMNSIVDEEIDTIHKAMSLTANKPNA